ncbi:hypothetical protein OJF2_78120 [Aquisphaera giovannonii]|uniref:Uncharacterized protein n=2 Tax=Aquisphaera giovannonii TaxID=406548 RepID=A0A5B9WH87_9BACT|nr:hypothetical protein OJF2_78120 [Aquisphaera giovannonii]
MAVSINLAFGLSACAGLSVIYLSLWPGKMAELPMDAIGSVRFWGPPLVLILIVLAAWDHRRPPRPIKVRHWLLLGASPLLLIGSVFIAESDVPFRAAFRLARPGLEAAVPTAPSSGHDGSPLGRDFGPYLVDRYGADPRGGVFFRVRTSPGGWGIDTMSYGFTFRPNAEGTPFGGARYEVFPLGGDWYWFHASDDHY